MDTGTSINTITSFDISIDVSFAFIRGIYRWCCYQYISFDISIDLSISFDFSIDLSFAFITGIYIDGVATCLFIFLFY